jgi:hypothetical protein
MKTNLSWQILILVAIIVAGGCKPKPNATMNTNDVLRLVEQYQHKQGADDFIGPELKKMGGKAQDSLIKILDDPKTSEANAGAIVEILHVNFPSEESYQAMERFGSRIADPNARAAFQNVLTAIRKDDPRQH